MGQGRTRQILAGLPPGGWSVVPGRRVSRSRTSPQMKDLRRGSSLRRRSPKPNDHRDHQMQSARGFIVRIHRYLWTSTQAPAGVSVSSEGLARLAEPGAGFIGGLGSRSRHTEADAWLHTIGCFKYSSEIITQQKSARRLGRPECQRLGAYQHSKDVWLKCNLGQAGGDAFLPDGP